MGNFKEDSKFLLKYLGGVRNISEVTHCVTRMRFVLKEPYQVHVDKIETLESVMGTFTSSGQFQVIIGSEVTAFFDDFLDVSAINIETEIINEVEVKVLNRKELKLIKRIEEKFEDFFSPARK